MFEEKLLKTLRGSSSPSWLKKWNGKMEKSTKEIGLIWLIGAGLIIAGLLLGHNRLSLVSALLVISGIFVIVFIPPCVYSHGKKHNSLWLFSLVVLPVAVIVMIQMINVERVGRKANEISCVANLKQIGLAMKQYAQDNKDWFPNKDGAEGFEILRREGYCIEHQVYICPMTGKRYSSGKNDRLTEDIVSYVYRSGLKEGNDPDIPLAWDKPENHQNYGSVLFMDGHVTGFTGPDWMEQAGIQNKTTKNTKDAKK